MKLSIIIPAYNAAKYIERCVNSIVSQNYSDMEILIVDDGSTDDTLELSRTISHKPLSIKVLHKENGGVSSARNYGMDNAIGTYLMFVDADDYLLPDTLAKAVEFAEKNRDADFCVFGFVRSARSGTATENILPSRIYHKTERLEYIKNLDTVSFGSTWSKLYKRDFITSHGLRFDTGIIASEDNCFNFNAVQVAEKIATSSLMVYFYDVNYQSATAKFIGEKYIENARAYINIIYHTIAEIVKENGEGASDNKNAASIIQYSHTTFCHNTLYQIYNIYRQKSDKIPDKYAWMKRMFHFMAEITPDWQQAFQTSFPRIFALSYRLHPRCADIIFRIIFTIKH